MKTLLCLISCLMLSINAAHAQTRKPNAPGSVKQSNATSPAAKGTSTAGNTDAADAALRQQIENLVAARMEQLNIPAYALSVVKDGRVILHNAYGFSNIADRKSATGETVFGLASVTKTFTAFVLLSLVDKGLIGLDDTLDKYLKDLTPQYGKLTIRQLASMTAGIPRNIGRQYVWRQQFNELVHTPLLSAPGSRYQYSNYSYRLLGLVIESVTGKTYFQVVKETVLEPFGMNTTGTPVTLEHSGLLAQPYDDQNGSAPVRPITYLSPDIAFSAGMLASNSDDMLKYALALMKGQILTPAAYQTLWYDRPPLTNGEPSNWAFGWGAKISPAFGGAKTVSMNGGIPGVASTMILLPEKNSAVVALCNLRKPPVYKIAKEVANMAFGRKGAVAQPVEAESESVPGVSDD